MGHGLKDKLASFEMITERLDDFKFGEMVQSEAFTFVNPYSVYLVQDNVDVEALSLLGVDSIMLVWILRYFEKWPITRCSFDMGSLCLYVSDLAMRRNLSVVFIGGLQEEQPRALANFQTIFGTDNSVTVFDGYFQDQPPLTFIDKCSQADIVVIGLGTPKQEEFMINLKKRFPTGKAFFTCGAFISQTSQCVKYYPEYINKFNLRWLYRAFGSPHVRRRLLLDYPKFLIRYCREGLS